MSEIEWNVHETKRPLLGKYYVPKRGRGRPRKNADPDEQMGDMSTIEAQVDPVPELAATVLPVNSATTLVGNESDVIAEKARDADAAVQRIRNRIAERKAEREKEKKEKVPLLREDHYSYSEEDMQLIALLCFVLGVTCGMLAFYLIFK